jgi:hypothetical protein
MSLRLNDVVLCLSLLAIGAVAAAAPTSAADPEGYKVAFSDSFASASDAGWHASRGTWKIVDGAWQGTEVASDKHAAVARHDLEFTDAVIDFEVKFDGARMASVSINDTKSHLCRLQIMPKSMRVMKDDSDKTGPDKAAVLADKPLDLQLGTWYHARIELRGEEFTAQVGDVSGGGHNPRIADKKANFAFVVGGESASFRNLRVLVPAK